MKKSPVYFIVIFVAIFFYVKTSPAVTLLIEEEALARIFPAVEKITQEKVTATEEQAGEIKKALGGSMVYKMRGPEASKIDSQRDFVFYYGRNADKLEGAALMLDEPGKWGPVKFIIRLSPSGDIQDAAVMKYSETRGRPIASRNFLKQFFGRTLNDRLELGKDIYGVSGATISSHAACFAVKKAMVLYKILVLKEKT